MLNTLKKEREEFLSQLRKIICQNNGSLAKRSFINDLCSIWAGSEKQEILLQIIKTKRGIFISLLLSDVLVFYKILFPISFV